MTFRQWPLLGAVIVWLLAGSLLPLSRIQAQTRTLTPERPTVEAGSTLRFFGENFVPRERVAWWTTSPGGVVLGGEWVDASRESGYFEIFFEVPETAEGGRWSLTAYGDVSQVPVITTFEVIGRTPDPNDPNEFQVRVAPPAGPPGTTFAFAATGFDDDEDVSYWVTEPGGTVYAAFPKGATANDDGRVDLTWQVPATAPRGTWVMTMQGYASGVARAVRFDVQ